MGEEDFVSDRNGEGILGEDGVDSGGCSESDERCENIKACNIKQPNDELGSDATNSGDEKQCGINDGLNMVVAGGSHIRAGDGVLDQATTLSHHFAAVPRWRTCSECLQRKVPKGADVCRQ